MTINERESKIYTTFLQINKCIEFDFKFNKKNTMEKVQYNKLLEVMIDEHFKYDTCKP